MFVTVVCSTNKCFSHIRLHPILVVNPFKGSITAFVCQPNPEEARAPSQALFKLMRNSEKTGGDKDAMNGCDSCN